MNLPLRLLFLRILEFEQSGIQVNGRNVNAEVEMWDVSGDHKYVIIYYFLTEKWLPRHTDNILSYYNYILI